MPFFEEICCGKLRVSFSALMFPALLWLQHHRAPPDQTTSSMEEFVLAGWDSQAWGGEGSCVSEKWEPDRAEGRQGSHINWVLPFCQKRQWSCCENHKNAQTPFFVAWFCTAGILATFWQLKPFLACTFSCIWHLARQCSHSRFFVPGARAGEEHACAEAAVRQSEPSPALLT